MTEPIYEYRTISNPNSYLAGEKVLVGHKFSFIKRRNMQYQRNYTGFKAKCSCKTKRFTIWHGTKYKALDEFNQHVVEMKAQALQLFETV